MAGLLQYLLLLMPFAVFAQVGIGNPRMGNDLAGNGNNNNGFDTTGTDLGGGANGGFTPDLGGGNGAVDPSMANGGTGNNAGRGNGGMTNVGYPDLGVPYGGGSRNVDQNVPGGQLGGSTDVPAISPTQNMADYDSNEGSGSSEDYTGSEGGAWYGGGGLGLLKSKGQRMTVTVLSCLLAVAIIALIAFFIIKRKRNNSGAAVNP